MRGNVRWFNVAKGYGELEAENGDIFFFTFRELRKRAKFKSIDPGTKVRFSGSIQRMFNFPVAKEIRVRKTS